MKYFDFYSWITLMGTTLWSLLLQNGSVDISLPGFMEMMMLRLLNVVFHIAGGQIVFHYKLIGWSHIVFSKIVLQVKYHLSKWFHFTVLENWFVINICSPTFYKVILLPYMYLVVCVHAFANQSIYNKTRYHTNHFCVARSRYSEEM